MAENSSIGLLVLHTGALGDCVLALHAIAAVREALSPERTVLAARSPIGRWAARHGVVDEALDLDDLGTHVLYAADGPQPGPLKAFVGGFDRVLSFLGGPDEPPSRRLAGWTRAPLVAIDPRPTAATLRDRRHIVQQWLDSMPSQLGRVKLGDAAAVRPTRDERQAARRMLAARLMTTKPSVPAAYHVSKTDRPIAIVHPGSGGLTKCCPLDALEAVVAGLSERGWSVGWMIGPDEVERFGGEYPRRLEKVARVIFEQHIESAADLILGANAYVGNDAGPTHVAALAGIRTVALFGPTDPEVWRPVGTRVIVGSFPAPGRDADDWGAAVLNSLDRIEQ